MALRVFYDGECPISSRYAGMLRLQQIPDVRLIDLRANPESRKMLAESGLDVDRGMVVDQDGKYLSGAQAINTLARLATPSGVLNRINRAIFASPPLTAVLFPLLRMGRWLVMLLFGRSLLQGEAGGDDARRTIFATCFALFSVFHFGNYATAYGRFPPGWDQLALLGAALLTFFKPHSNRALFLLMLASLVSAWVQAPAQSNHTITRNFLLLGYWLSFAVAIVRNLRPEAIFGNFVIAGQSVLIVMYLFGIFHKLNTDFLNPLTSCATALWRTMPWPIPMFRGPAVDAATIYGTFVVEGGIIIALLVRRWRHVGVSLGIVFHLLLALSSFAMYIAFTALSIAMHALFLSDVASKKLLESQEMKIIRSRLRDPVYLICAFVLLISLGVVAFIGQYSMASLFALPIVLPFCYLILRVGRDADAPQQRRGIAWTVAAVTGALFFANCALPYLGLKTAQSLNMFANLRLEGSVSNHLIFSHPPGPFRYLDDVAILTDDGGDPNLSYYRASGYGIVYYDLLAVLDQNPSLKVSYLRSKRSYTDVGASDLEADIAATLHPRWFRKWFHFQPVQLEQPERCSI